jgi:hypothetical protein
VNDDGDNITNSFLQVQYRWRKEADQAGQPIKRVVVAYEAGRDGFWLARWLRMRSAKELDQQYQKLMYHCEAEFASAVTHVDGFFRKLQLSVSSLGAPSDNLS